MKIKILNREQAELDRQVREGVITPSVEVHDYREIEPLVEALLPVEDTEAPKLSPLTLSFPSPLELLLFVRPMCKPHKWQAEELRRLGGFLDLVTKTKVTREEPFLINYVAANGSGKDEYLIAAFNLWFILSGHNNLVINTSASFQQLKYQTEVHINYLIKLLNATLGQEIVQSKDMYKYCRLTNSEIKLFATDEAGRAEGFHPRSGGEMAIVVNEAKSVSDEIFDALMRCSGYSYWLNVSSPGARAGRLYTSYVESIKHPEPQVLGKWYSRRITAYECPHIPKLHIEECRKRMPPEWFKSSIEAEFIDSESNTVISIALWERSLYNVPKNDLEQYTYTLGVDIGLGGDETCCVLRRKMEVVDIFTFRSDSTLETTNAIHARYSYILSDKHIAIFDDSSAGHAVVDNLIARGWRIIRVLNQASALDSSTYLNRGAELFFNVRWLLELGWIKSYEADKILTRQITSRRYLYRDNGKIKLEPKPVHRAVFGESPDRADAFVLCYSTIAARPSTTRASTEPARTKTLNQIKEEVEWGSVKFKPLFRQGQEKPNRTTYVLKNL